MSAWARPQDEPPPLPNLRFQFWGVFFEVVVCEIHDYRELNLSTQGQPIPPKKHTQICPLCLKSARLRALTETDPKTDPKTDPISLFRAIAHGRRGVRRAAGLSMHGAVHAWGCHRARHFSRFLAFSLDLAIALFLTQRPLSPILSPDLKRRPRKRGKRRTVPPRG